MGSCKNKRLIGPFLDGQLGECKWLEEHIAECSECLAEYESVQRLAHLAHKADFPPPESSYWKKFSTRVIARIAARPQPSRYARIFDNIFANKLALRLVTPLLIVMIAVLAIRLYLPAKDMRLSQAASQTADNNISTQNEPVPLTDISLKLGALAEPPNKQSSSLQPAAGLISQVPKSAAETQSQNYAIDNTAIELAQNEMQTKNDSSANIGNIDNLVQDFLAHNPIKTTQRKNYGLSKGSWREMALDLKLKAFNTDEIIKFQILSGSNPSLAPLSSYREATGKFFAPQMSTSRPLFGQETPYRWGYAVGGENFNMDRLHHLELELDLIREK